MVKKAILISTLTHGSELQTDILNKATKIQLKCIKLLQKQTEKSEKKSASEPNIYL